MCFNAVGRCLWRRLEVYISNCLRVCTTTRRLEQEVNGLRQLRRKSGFPRDALERLGRQRVLSSPPGGRSLLDRFKTGVRYRTLAAFL